MYSCSHGYKNKIYREKFYFYAGFFRSAWLCASQKYQPREPKEILQKATPSDTADGSDSIGSVGLRGGYFFPVGGLSDSLSGGFAVGLYFDMNPDVFLGDTKKLPAYIPSAQVMVNFEGLSGAGNSLTHIGFMVGPSWSFSLGQIAQKGSQFINAGLLWGIAIISGKNENFSPVQ